MAKSAELETNPTCPVSSEIFKRYIKETNTDNQGNIQRKFYLVDVEAIAATACVLPDIGHENSGAVLCMVPRDEWAKQFRDWLIDEHGRHFAKN